MIWFDAKQRANRILYGFIVVVTALYFPMIFPGILGAALKTSWY